MEAILFALLFMKDVCICKYTPATLKKELFIADCADFFQRNPYESYNPRLYYRRLSQFNVLLLNQLWNFTVHIVGDQFTDC